MRDIDTIIETLRTTQPDIRVEQLRVLHPGADDDGLWFFTRPGCATEVQLESSTGECPFLLESDVLPSSTTAATITDAISLVNQGLDVDTSTA